MNKQALLEGLSQIPASWVLTPVNERKAPYRMRWQVEAPLERWFIEEEIREGWAKGYGLRLGEVSVYQGGYLLAVDFTDPVPGGSDRELSGGSDPPATVSWTSGKPGREQRLFCVKAPKGSNFRNRVAFKTGVIGADGKEEQLELRFNHCQSVLPPSVHPETGYYRWIIAPFNSGEATLVAAAPKWMVKLLINPPNSNSKNGFHTNGNGHQDALSRALRYLEALDPHLADDYDTWIHVGMALHSVGDESLLAEWDRWSRQSAKHKTGECEQKWKSFNSSGISLGTLAHLAQQNGFPPPSPSKNPSNPPKQDHSKPPKSESRRSTPSSFEGEA
ncbi:MAG: hypothetical protein HC921_20500 [Synechococcaceae cyanobacterium SM2_3_1]|nr:hypothetical protein [Synechococcaceae cyanobacterium SM2_3_1]